MDPFCEGWSCALAPVELMVILLWACSWWGFSGSGIEAWIYWDVDYRRKSSAHWHGLQNLHWLQQGQDLQCDQRDLGAVSWTVLLNLLHICQFIKFEIQLFSQTERRSNLRSTSIRGSSVPPPHPLVGRCQGVSKRFTNVENPEELWVLEQLRR